MKILAVVPLIVALAGCGGGSSSDGGGSGGDSGSNSLINAIPKSGGFDPVNTIGSGVYSQARSLNIQESTLKALCESAYQNDSYVHVQTSCTMSSDTLAITYYQRDGLDQTNIAFYISPEAINRSQVDMTVYQGIHSLTTFDSFTTTGGGFFSFKWTDRYGDMQESFVSYDVEDYRGQPLDGAILSGDKGGLFVSNFMMADFSKTTPRVSVDMAINDHLFYDQFKNDVVSSKFLSNLQAVIKESYQL